MKARGGARRSACKVGKDPGDHTLASEGAHAVLGVSTAHARTLLYGGLLFVQVEIAGGLGHWRGARAARGLNAAQAAQA